MQYFVSRQHYYYGDLRAVEIARGGLDNVSPGMLTACYPDEGMTFYDPREAAEAAIKIRDAWAKDTPQLTIYLAAGSTGGGLLSQILDDGAEDAKSPEELRAWAKEQYEQLSKCDHCGELIKGKPLSLDGDDSWKFCSVDCLESYQSAAHSERKLCDHCGEFYDGIGVGVEHVVKYDGFNHDVAWNFCSDRCLQQCKADGYLDEVEPGHFIYMSSEEYGTERFGPYDSKEEAFQGMTRIMDKTDKLNDRVHRSFWYSTNANEIEEGL